MMAIAMFPVAPVHAMTESDAVEWAKSQVGTMIGDGQCTRLSEAYAWQFFGFGLNESPKDYPTLDVRDGWELIRYNSGFVPSPGDIAIWEPGSGSWGWVGDTGHTAVILSATGSEIISVDQNSGAGGRGSAAEIVTHSYNSFWGVLRPPFDGKEGHQVPRPNAGITAGDTVINSGESANLTIEFSGIGPWTLVYMEDNAERTQDFYEHEGVLTVYPDKTTVYSLISVTDSSYYNFTEFLDGKVTVTLLRLEDASAWARAGITSAITKGFVPSDIQSHYTNEITRAEFCRMAVKWVEHAVGKNIEAVLSEKGLSREPDAFADTNDPDILAAYALGITNGTGLGVFSPNAQFTREQAAAMITNTCRAIGANADNAPASGFADIEKASSWAASGIDFVRVNGIMQGTGDNNFSPKANYTREQGIITFNNIDIENLPIQ
jgi:hypothetical protein